MNYYTPKTKTPHSSVGYFPEENEFYHPWSIKSSGRFYAFHKLKDLISLKEFMEWPMCITDDLIEGLTEGAKERDKIDNPPEAAGKSKVDKDLNDLVKQLGLDKKLQI